MQQEPVSRNSRQAKSAFESNVRSLARFRYNLRKFLRFSEKAARECGVTPQQHQLMLGVAGFTGRGTATVSELAEFLQERHNSVVGLVERAASRGLVRREHDVSDRRVAIVSLTREGEKILSKLAKLHEDELRHARANFMKVQKTGNPSRSKAGTMKGRPPFSLSSLRA